MIFIDIDGVLIDFYGTTKKFGIELKINEFGKWKWGEPPYPAPEEFYAKAELQPWAEELLKKVLAEGENIALITRDYAPIKIKALASMKPLSVFSEHFKSCYQSLDKSIYLSHATDLLIDDCAAECEAWRNKGGIAYHFNLASDDPFKNFIQWWEV
jgi:hypothetical protein